MLVVLLHIGIATLLLRAMALQCPQLVLLQLTLVIILLLLLLLPLSLLLLLLLLQGGFEPVLLPPGSRLVPERLLCLQCLELHPLSLHQT